LDRVLRTVCSWKKRLRRHLADELAAASGLNRPSSTPSSAKEQSLHRDPAPYTAPGRSKVYEEIPGWTRNDRAGRLGKVIKPTNRSKPPHDAPDGLRN